MKNIALIPARGGSKRLPRKNLMDFSGRPILAWTIDAARHAGCFERIIVSTDSDEIAQAAVGAGAEVAPRPEALAVDAAQVVEVCLEFLSRPDIAAIGYDTMTVLYPTAPLRTSGDIIATLALLEHGLCDFALAVSEYDLPAYQALQMGDDGSLKPLMPELVDLRSQDIGPLRVDNGSTYCVRIAAFIEQRSFYGPGLRGHSMPRNRSVDIDTVDDLRLAIYWANLQDEDPRRDK